jgi:hypothetical protein
MRGDGLESSSTIFAGLKWGGPTCAKRRCPH